MGVKETGISTPFEIGEGFSSCFVMPRKCPFYGLLRGFYFLSCIIKHRHFLNNLCSRNNNESRKCVD